MVGLKIHQERVIMIEENFIFIGQKLEDGSYSAVLFSNDSIEEFILSEDKQSSDIHSFLDLDYMGGNCYKIKSYEELPDINEFLYSNKDYRNQNFFYQEPEWGDS